MFVKLQKKGERVFGWRGSREAARKPHNQIEEDCLEFGQVEPGPPKRRQKV
jgi:hypothetical protein